MFEVDQRITADPLNECQSCHELGTIRRLIQPTAIMFKGQGFYINDSARPSSQPSDPAKSDATAGDAESPKADAPATKAPESATSTTPDSNPTPAAPKAESKPSTPSVNPDK